MQLPEACRGENSHARDSQQRQEILDMRGHQVRLFRVVPARGWIRQSCTCEADKERVSGCMSKLEGRGYSPLSKRTTDSNFGNRRGPTSTAGGTRKCKCDLTAVFREVYSEGPNKGRSYWTCPNTSNKAKCGFFEWDDGASGSADAGPSNSRASGSGSTGNACYKCGEPGHFANGE